MTPREHVADWKQELTSIANELEAVELGDGSEFLLRRAATEIQAAIDWLAIFDAEKAGVV